MSGGLCSAISHTGEGRARTELKSRCNQIEPLGSFSVPLLIPVPGSVKQVLL